MPRSGATSSNISVVEVIQRSGHCCSLQAYQHHFSSLFSLFSGEALAVWTTVSKNAFFSQRSLSIMGLELVAETVVLLGTVLFARQRDSFDLHVGRFLFL